MGGWVGETGFKKKRTPLLLELKRMSFFWFFLFLSRKAFSCPNSMVLGEVEWDKFCSFQAFFNHFCYDIDSVDLSDPAIPHSRVGIGDAETWDASRHVL